MKSRSLISHLVVLCSGFLSLIDPSTAVSVVVLPATTTKTKDVRASLNSGSRNHSSVPFGPYNTMSPDFPWSTTERTRRIVTPPIDRKDCIVGSWGRWVRTGNFHVRHRSRIQKPKNGGLKCPPLVTAHKVKHEYRVNKLTFDESSRRFLGSLIRGGASGDIQGDDPRHRSVATRHRKNGRHERKKFSNHYLTKNYVWPKRLLHTVLDDSLCVRKTSLGLKTKFMVLSLLESLCGTTYDSNAPAVGVQTYSVDSKMILPLERPETKRKLRHSVLAYTTEPVKHLQLDKALQRTVSILNETISRRKSSWKSAVMLVLSSWNYCDENTLGEAVLIKEHADVYLLLIGPEPDTTQIQCFSSLASQPVEDHYIRLPDTDSINDFIAKILVAYYRNTFC